VVLGTIEREASEGERWRREVRFAETRARIEDLRALEANERRAAGVDVVGRKMEM